MTSSVDITIQRIGLRAIQEFAGTVKMSGVGWYLQRLNFTPKYFYDAIMTGIFLKQITQTFPLNGLNTYASSLLLTTFWTHHL